MTAIVAAIISLGCSQPPNRWSHLGRISDQHSITIINLPRPQSLVLVIILNLPSLAAEPYEDTSCSCCTAVTMTTSSSHVRRRLLHTASLPVSVPRISTMMKWCWRRCFYNYQWESSSQQRTKFYEGKTLNYYIIIFMIHLKFFLTILTLISNEFSSHIAI